MTTSHTVRTGQRLLLDLAQLTRDNVALAGGKGANLGELVRAGFPVPPGFVLTTAAYNALLEGGTGDDLRRLLEQGAEPEQLRRVLLEADVPPELLDELTQAYARLDVAAVAVRSSATAEDLPGATFAGQQDTELNVVGAEAVVPAVRRCWASLWTDRAVAYRREHRVDPSSISMAVVVQAMVPADVAGVMFSADPVTGRRDRVVVDASPGLGEAVVSGRVTPEHYVLDAQDQLLGWTPGVAEVVISSSPGGGTREDIGQPRTEPLLSPAQQVELAGLARRAATLFGRPQDLEWAVADGAVWLVQARPLTALPPEPVHVSALHRRIAPFYVEMFSTRPYPLDITAWFVPGIVAMLQRMAGSIGIGFPPAREFVVEEDCVVVAMRPPTPRPTWRVLAAPVSVVRRVRRYPVLTWTDDPRFVSFTQQADRLRDLDVTPLWWGQLLGVVDDALHVAAMVTGLRVSYLPGAFAVQVPFRLLLLGLGRADLAPALLAGAITRTRQANDALEALATEVRADPVMREAFASSEPTALVARLGEPAFADFGRSFEAFLREYGHRETVSVVLVTPPTWADAPEVVLGIVKVLLADQPTSHAPGADAERELLAHPWLQRPAARRRVERLLAAVRRGVAFREDSHFYLTRALPPLRRALLELGARLVAVGTLDEPEDVFHLRLEELRALPDGAPGPEERERLRRLVASRRARREEVAAVPMVDLAAYFPERRPSGDEDALLCGTAASRGRATGTVRVVHGPAEFDRLRSGDVLVCPYTNPSWTPLFPRAAAVVVDTGGLGSHAAIVAREYGIPAVMGTRTGTSTLVDGQRVTVDGSTGVVVAAEDAP